MENNKNTIKIYCITKILYTFFNLTLIAVGAHSQKHEKQPKTSILEYIILIYVQYNESAVFLKIYTQASDRSASV